MNQKEFYVDTKCTIWHREFYTVPADMTQEQFKEKIIEEGLSGDSCEYLYETSEDVSLKENDNQSTFEMFEEGVEFYNNAEVNEVNKDQYPGADRVD